MIQLIYLMPLYQVRYVDNLFRNFDYDNNMLVFASVIGVLCYILGHRTGSAKWKIRMYRSRGMPTHVIVDVEGNCFYSLYERAKKLYGVMYFKNKDFLKAIGRGTHIVGVDHGSKFSVHEFVKTAHALGLDVVLRQRVDGKSVHEEGDELTVTVKEDGPLITEE